MSESKKKILLGCTASVATIKLPVIVQNLRQKFPDSAEIRCVLTENAKKFLPQDLKEIGADIIYSDEDEWKEWNDNKSVLHIELVQNWCDIFVIAPLDANSLSKLANGSCDNLLTSMARAWDFQSGKRIVIAPAMNTKMWEHPVTEPQLQTLRSWGYLEISPISKRLACNVVGMGAMAEPSTIVDFIEKILTNNKPEKKSGEL